MFSRTASRMSAYAASSTASPSWKSMVRTELLSSLALKSLFEEVPSLAMQGSLRYSIIGADRWPRHTASQRSHRVLRAGDAQGDAALWRRGDPDVACQGRARGQ